jgi:hypothetical protein
MSKKTIGEMQDEPLEAPKTAKAAAPEYTGDIGAPSGNLLKQIASAFIFDKQTDAVKAWYAECKRVGFYEEM